MVAVRKRLPRTVLIVEDDHTIRELLKALFEEEGYRVYAAFDGETAVSLARRVKPSLITLDLALPKLDGNGVLSLLAANPETASIPVIVLSANPDCLNGKLSVGAVLSKPFDLDDLTITAQALTVHNRRTVRPRQVVAN